MLTEEEKREIERELVHYQKKRAACIEAMKILQRHRGWVSDEALQDIAAMVGMTPDELDGVATFYNLIFRKPVGRHVILICDSISCWIMRYEDILGHLESRHSIRLGETTSDGEFTLLPVPCLGACDEAPALMIDWDLYTGLTADRVDEILEKYRGEEK